MQTLALMLWRVYVQVVQGAKAVRSVGRIVRTRDVDGRSSTVRLWLKGGVPHLHGIIYGSAEQSDFRLVWERVMSALLNPAG